MIKLYLDENIPYSVAYGLRLRGFDVVTTYKAGNTGKTDEEQLLFASKQNRVIFTFNVKDFCKLHIEFLSKSKTHKGIIVSRPFPTSVVIKGLAKILVLYDQKEMENNLLWLSNFL
jgi:predicted nuclease of predicted toxin-antitoxin system